MNFLNNNIENLNLNKKIDCQLLAISSIDRNYNNYDSNQLLNPENLNNFIVDFANNNTSNANINSTYKNINI